MATPALPLDTAAVARWLASTGVKMPGPLSAEKFAHGQSNPTYRLQGQAGSYVLRRKPPGTLLRSAHAIDREYRVQRALADRDVPVPRMLAYCADETVIGSAFYVMEDVAGVAHPAPDLPGEDKAQRRAIIAEMARVLAAIHKVDPDAAGLSDYGPRGDYCARQIARWSKQYRATATEEIPAMEALIAWLEAHTPPEDGRLTLVHGDYRLDNLLFDGTRCAAVLDWELSTLGHPFADLAAVIMQWQRPPGPEHRGLAGIDRAALGLPSDAAFVADYAAHMGLDTVPDLPFYLAFAFFRMAAILQGVKRRALEGNASNPEEGLRMGAYVGEYAEQGLAAAKGR